MKKYFLIALFQSATLNAVDLLDAPGPGYRELRIFPLPMRYRPDLLDALPPSRVPSVPWESRVSPQQIEVIIEQLRERATLYIRAPYVLPRTFSSFEPLLPTTTLPELTRANPFDTPIRLFRQNP